MATRTQRRTTIAQTVGEIQHACQVILESLARHMDEGRADLSPTVRQMAAAMLELNFQVGALEGSDQAWASIRRGDTMEDGS